MASVVDHITSYGASAKYEDFPPEVLHKVKGLLIDTLGCAIGAYASETAKIARRIAERVHDCETPGTIIGSGQKSSLDLATFANGVMMRYLDFNDGIGNKGGGHTSDNFASCLTCADAVHASGKEFITASVLAYEVFIRLGDQMSIKSKGFDHPVYGIVSHVMGASKILGLSREQMAQAINLALAPSIALRQSNIGEVSMWKACRMANAARNAVFATLLAKEGMTGPSPIFEGRFGLFKVVTGPFQLDEFGGNGRPFRIMDANIKRYPCGQYAQTIIEAALKVRSRISSLDEISEINIGTLADSVLIMAGDVEKWQPETRESADHSIPYVTAVALMHGPVEKRHFDDEYLHSPALLELMRKTKVEESEEVSKLFPAHAGRVEVVTRSGERFSELVVYHGGHHRNPLTNEGIEQKFHSLARDVLLPSQRKELFSLIWNLEQVEDTSRIMQLLRI